MPTYSEFRGKGIYIQPVESETGEFAVFAQSCAHALGRTGRALKVFAIAPIVAVGVLSLVTGITSPALGMLSPLLFIAGSMMETRALEMQHREMSLTVRRDRPYTAQAR